MKKQTIYKWNIMCNHCHKIIDEEYNGNIIRAIREQGIQTQKAKQKDFLKELKRNIKEHYDNQSNCRDIDEIWLSPDDCNEIINTLATKHFGAGAELTK